MTSGGEVRIDNRGISALELIAPITAPLSLRLQKRED